MRGNFLVETAVDILRTGIAAGRWHGYLPGIHQLRLETDFGRSTLERALGLLAIEGVIEEAKHGQRRAILRLPAAEGRVANRRLGLIFPFPWRDADREDVEFVSGLQLALEREGCELVMHRSHRTISTGFEEIRKQAEFNPPDAWAVYQGTRRVIRECMQDGKRMLAIGGAVADLEVDAIAWDGDVLVTKALEMLLKAGHRRIVLPLVRTWHDGEHRGVRAFNREMNRAGIALQPSFHLPVVQEGNEPFREVLENLWKLTPPTAMIVQTAAQAVAVLCFASSRGLSIPEDVSVVALCANPVLRETSPAICSLAIESSKLVPHVVNWFMQPPAPPRKILLRQMFTAGESIAPPPIALRGRGGSL